MGFTAVLQETNGVVEEILGAVEKGKSPLSPLQRRGGLEALIVALDRQMPDAPGLLHAPDLLRRIGWAGSDGQDLMGRI